MVVSAGDMNGHVGSSNAGYDGTHGGYGYGYRNADGSRIFEFTDRLNPVICSTLFMMQESKLVTYVAGSVKCIVDCINHTAGSGLDPGTAARSSWPAGAGGRRPHQGVPHRPHS